VRFEETFPNHKTIELPDTNHFFFEDVADQMMLEIRAFVSSDPTGPAKLQRGRER
jgi:haloalkane dehalogenase